jgi:cell division protein FtsL
MAKTHVIRALQIVAAILVAVLAIGLYRAKSDAAKTEARVRELQEEISEREATLRELRAEIARRESPASIEALAEERLGAVVGSESPALPEAAIGERLPPPQPQRPRP